MECNKEESIKARTIAQLKLQNGDFEGAKRFALKAKKLFPDLENIMQLLTLCDVHRCANRDGSEMDWYAILQIERSADECSIKKHYRKLTLLLHPDKNKFAGAETAFKLIGEAIAVLTDPTKRSQYDMRTAPKPKPTPPDQTKTTPNTTRPGPSNTTNAHASSDLTKCSQYDHTKTAPKQAPHGSNTTGSSSTHRQDESTNNKQYSCLNFTFHLDRKNCSSFTFQYDPRTGWSNVTAPYDVKTAPMPTPQQHVFTNNNQNGCSNSAASSSYHRPPCIAYHSYYSAMHRWLHCPYCGSSIGRNF